MMEEQSRETCGYGYYLGLQERTYVSFEEGLKLEKHIKMYSCCCNQDVMNHDYFDILEIEREGVPMIHALLEEGEYPDVCVFCKYYKPLEEQILKSIVDRIKENNIH